MIVLALDQSPTVTGFGYASDDEAAKPGFGVQEHPDYGDADQHLMRHYREWLRNLIKSSGTVALYFEQIIFYPNRIHKPSLDKQYAVQGAIQFTCMDLGIESFEVNIGEWRKRFLGRGNAPKWTNDRTGWLKDAAKIECARRGWLTDNHHAAEALGILDYGLAHASLTYRRRTGPTTRRAELKAMQAEAV